MKIAILAWGSLIWDPRDLAISGDWQTGGPVLPIEFSRISGDGRLTLVIDEKDGVMSPTRFAMSAKQTLPRAISNLVEREGAPYRNRIGYLDQRKGLTSSRAQKKHPAACQMIRSWLKQSGFEAVIWTGLDPNFQEKVGTAFSPEAAIRYVERLPEETRLRAVEYIRNAPKEIVTPFRRLFDVRLS